MLTKQQKRNNYLRNQTKCKLCGGYVDRECLIDDKINRTWVNKITELCNLCSLKELEEE